MPNLSTPNQVWTDRNLSNREVRRRHPHQRHGQRVKIDLNRDATARQKESDVRRAPYGARRTRSVALPTATRKYRTGDLTPRNIAVSSSRSRSARAASVSASFATASNDHLAAATLMFEAGCGISHGAEVVEHLPRRNGDARSGMKSQLQHDGGRTRASAAGGVEACDFILDCERRARYRRGMRRRP